VSFIQSKEGSSWAITLNLSVIFFAPIKNKLLIQHPWCLRLSASRTMYLPVWMTCILLLSLHCYIQGSKKHWALSERGGST
jgi:hypothetical protein